MYKAFGKPKEVAKREVRGGIQSTLQQQILKNLNQEENQTIVAASIMTCMALLFSRCSWYGLGQYLCYVIIISNTDKVSFVVDHLSPYIEDFTVYWENSIHQNIKIAIVLSLTVFAWMSWQLRCILIAIIGARALKSYSKVTASKPSGSTAVHPLSWPVTSPGTRQESTTQQKKVPSTTKDLLNRKKVGFYDTDGVGGQPSRQVPRRTPGVKTQLRAVSAFDSPPSSRSVSPMNSSSTTKTKMLDDSDRENNLLYERFHDSSLGDGYGDGDNVFGHGYPGPVQTQTSKAKKSPKKSPTQQVQIQKPSQSPTRMQTRYGQMSQSPTLSPAPVLSGRYPSLSSAGR
jgi:hypothetical protein